jgi:predicted GH43/DUF377 family glycosyl hydrolase
MDKVTVKDEGIILEATNLDFENEAVLNPTCVTIDSVVHMFYRAVSKNQMISSIGYAQLADNKIISRAKEPILKPEHDYEKMGIEDPRITCLGDTYYIFYTAYDGKDARVAYATSKDLKNFTKQGLVIPALTYDEAEQSFCIHSSAAARFELYKKRYKFRLEPDALLWEKDAFLFPKKINGRCALMIRILPGIQVIYFEDFNQLKSHKYWDTYLHNLDSFVIMEPKFIFEHKHIGGGCPPIETKDGWLLLYHAVEDTPEGVIYYGCAALLDLDDPTKIIGRLDYPLLEPEAPWEQKGDVSNVVFPTGTHIDGDRLYVYYGAADKLIAIKSLFLEELILALKHCT